MAKMEDAFNDFYNEFKDWTKKQILHRTFDIILKDTEEIGEKDKEIERLSNKYNKALELLTDFNMPCEMAQNKIPDEYCEENCDVDDETYKKCWNKYIELELKEGKENDK